MKKIILAVFLIFCLKNLAFAFVGTWARTGGGNWNQNASWNPNTNFPHNINDEAILQNIIGPSAITLGQNIIIGTLTFSSNQSFTINSGNTLIFDSTGSSLITNSLGGFHYINSDIQLNKDLVCNVSAIPLTLSGAISQFGGSHGITIDATNNAQIFFSGSNPNTYTGTTIINSGTLYLSKDANVTAIPGDLIINGSAIVSCDENQFAPTSNVIMHGGVFNVPASNTISSLTCDDNIFFPSSGLLSLTSAVTPLTVGSNVVINNPINLTGIGGDIVYNGTTQSSFLFANLDLGSQTRIFNIAHGTGLDFYIIGVISNGGIIKTGAGTFVLSGANTYSGGTAINDGTIYIFADNNLGTGDISFDGGTLHSSGNISTVKAVTLNASGGTFDVASDTLTLTSSITGAGTLTKTGAGTLSFSGSDKNYSGNTAINDGIFISNSNIPNSAISVTDAEIKGNFTAKSLTANSGGFVRPGNSIGTIYVTDLTLNSDSTYEVEINQTSSDRIIVSNLATINPGAILEVLPLTTALIPEHRYEIITVSGINPVSGTFTNIIFDNPSVTGTIFYNLGGNNVILELAPGSLQNTVTGGNPGAVAAYLDSLSTPFGSDLQNIIDILVIMPEDQMREALDQLHPAIFKGFALSQHNILNIRKIIQEKSNEFYQNCCIRNIPCKKKISVWATPYGSFLSQQDYTSGDFYYMGFNTDSIGIVMGSDFMIKRNWYLGLSGAYSYSDIRWHDKRGKGDISSYYGNIYTSYHTNKFFINSALFGAYNHFEGHRYIRFSSVDRTAKNKHSGGEFLAHLDTGLIYHFKNSFELKPFVSGDYLYLKENSFTEKGAGSLNLHVQKSNYNTYRFEAGTYAGACFMYCRDKILPDIKLSYIREINDRGKYYTCNLVNEPGSFKAKGPRPKRNIFSPGASISMLYCKDRAKLSVRYDGEFAKNYSNNVVNLELATQF